MPALLLDDNQMLTELAVILQYLADKKNAVTLLPPVNHFNRYRVLEWVNYVSTELHKGCSPLFNPRVPVEVKDEIFKPVFKKQIKICE